MTCARLWGDDQTNGFIHWDGRRVAGIPICGETPGSKSTETGQMRAHHWRRYEIAC